MQRNALPAAVCLTLVVFSCLAFGQQQKPSEPPNMATVLNRQLGNLEREFVSAAEAMPEDKFGFAPTNGEFKGVRNFAQQIKHVAASNYQFAAAILEEAPPAAAQSEDGPETMKSKADIIKFLKDSFDYTHKAFATISEKNATTPIKSPFGQGTVTRLGMATLTVGHGFDHYGQMVEYLRMNGIIPPASRGQ
jgi:uncharacterized damage-inducible protein DinB